MNYFGAAFTYQDTNGVEHIYFTTNSGNDVIEIEQGGIILDNSGYSGTAVGRALGVSSESTNSNDGMSCKGQMIARIAFPTCGDKNGGSIAPNPNPVRCPTQICCFPF